MTVYHARGLMIGSPVQCAFWLVLGSQRTFARCMVSHVWVSCRAFHPRQHVWVNLVAGSSPFFRTDTSLSNRHQSVFPDLGGEHVGGSR